MFDQGRRQSEVAAELGVSAQAVSKWHRAWSAGEREAMAGAAVPGGCASSPMSDWPRSRPS
ncbi:helix-turn-helix domain-containing protein [Saccharopolyspora spinosa]|uniref:helix-turn-helix domain-containing protein n=1 Tax=Saccharopolyspora spinosa TaxID=60894 RepID=UPI00376EBC6B